MCRFRCNIETLGWVENTTGRWFLRKLDLNIKYLTNCGAAREARGRLLRLGRHGPSRGFVGQDVYQVVGRHGKEGQKVKADAQEDQENF